MISTRFDQTEKWITGYGEVHNIKDMETTHILNIIRMFETKPTMLQTFLINDVTNNKVWTPNPGSSKISLNNITSMSVEELKNYFHNCPLFIAMKAELNERGVNLEQMLLNFKE